MTMVTSEKIDNAPVSSDYRRLKELLRELFQLDNAELDFGVYRIMNQKREDIERFLDGELLPQVQKEFERYQTGDHIAIHAELNEAVESARKLGADPETMPRVIELRQKLGDVTDFKRLEDEVYSDLLTFFRRYYQDGDFLSLPRYKKNTYAIPYEGEEVKLYWANADQYYIKTSERLREYTFRLSDGRRVHFKLVEADTERDNNKAADDKERRFMLSQEDMIAESNGELFVYFTYQTDPEKRKQISLITEAVEKIFAAQGFDDWKPALREKAPTTKNAERTLLEKHLTNYTARNTFDYFIHKDLGGFLRRELDFFIKNEVVHLDDVEEETAPRVEQYLSKIKVLRRIGGKIIQFLAQIEDFQKRLFLKKKFVVESNYCVTLDRIPKELYTEILTNEAQLAEWRRLFVIDEIKSDLFKKGGDGKLDEAFLEANPYLILDTKFFPQGFKNKLLSSFVNLDQQTNGLLIHSENFQALNLLQERYREQVKCIYIDPPYNTPHSRILYKNNYLHSTWLTLINQTLTLVPRLLSETSSFGAAIDDYEQANLACLLDSTFPNLERSTIVVNHHPQGAGGRLSRTHEYYMILSPATAPPLHGEPRQDEEEDRNFMRSGTAENNYRYGRWKSFYALLYDPSANKIVDAEPPPDLGGAYPTEPTEQGLERIYPINSRGEERVWRASFESGKQKAQEGELIRTSRGAIYQQLDHSGKRETVFSNWTDPSFNAGIHGTNLLNNLGLAEQFDYPKSLFTLTTGLWAQTFGDNEALILDYFGGSGTTGHAVIHMNRSDMGERKYILVEMGNYFNDVTKPRIQKIIYSKDWKDGKPVSREGSSHMFKYIRLESYEDALNNIKELRRPEEQQRALLSATPQVREQYMLSYMLDVESRGSTSLIDIDAFENPFSYELNIATNTVGETRPMAVDLVETFNYLIGLRVEKIQGSGAFLTVRGSTLRGERVLIIWRNRKESSNTDLEEFFTENFQNHDEFDVVYINGDNNLANLRGDEETWQTRLIEDDFQRLMFGVRDVQ